MAQTKSSLDQVFSGVKSHFDGHRTSTELSMVELLRKVHPDCSVVSAFPHYFDLLGYAKAGHATAILTIEDDTIDTTRSYKGPNSRLSREAGELLLHNRFARWRYTWKNYEFTLYEIEYQDQRGVAMKLHFLISQNQIVRPPETPPVDQMLLAVALWTKDLHEEVYVFDAGHWSKSKELWTSVQGSTWEQVILEPVMKENLIKDVQSFFDNQQLYKKLSVPWKRGLILHGLPGNGKTISIKALINTLYARKDPVPSLYVKSFDDACRTEQASIRSIFSHARRMAPCLLIFEDLDSLITDKTRSYFLNEVDGLESNDGILMIGSTNHLDSLDPAISKRPSRFDRKYNFKLPGQEERAAYCRFWREKLLDSDLVDFNVGLCDVIAKLTEGFSFAYLKELFVIALLTIARGGTGHELEEDTAASQKASSSDDGHVVVQHADAKEEITGTTAATETIIKSVSAEAVQATERPKKQRAMPEVDIPEELEDNVLLKVLMTQVKFLLDEMDNTKEVDWPSDRTRGGVPGSLNGARRIVRTVQAVPM